MAALLLISILFMVADCLVRILCIFTVSSKFWKGCTPLQPSWVMEWLIECNSYQVGLLSFTNMQQRHLPHPWPGGRSHMISMVLNAKNLPLFQWGWSGLNIHCHLFVIFHYQKMFITLFNTEVFWPPLGTLGTIAIKSSEAMKESYFSTDFLSSVL